MKITEASESDIREMVNRINNRQSDRKAQKDMEEVVRMVQKTPFVKAPREAKEKKNDSLFLNGLNLVFIASLGALLWNLTGHYFFLFFFAAVSLMAAIEFKKAFT